MNIPPFTTQRREAAALENRARAKRSEISRLWRMVFQAEHAARRLRNYGKVNKTGRTKKQLTEK